MTSTTYAWRVIQLLTNGGFETGSGTSFTGWTTSGSVAEITSSVHGGSRAIGLNQSAYAYQERKFADGTAGRYVDQYDDLLLTCWLKTISGTVDRGQVKVFITNAASDPQYYFDFHAGKWYAIGTYTQATAPGGFEIYLTDGGTWTEYNLPKIYAPIEAGIDVADNWFLRVAFINSTSVTGQLGIDDANLAPWPGDCRAERLGRYVVAHNRGASYPVKYDLRNGTVTELSLHPPYWTANSALPTITKATTGGLLKADYYYGYVFAYINADSGELSALPVGVQSSSGVFTEQADTGADTQKLTLDFSACEIPNKENDVDADNDEQTHIAVFRTIGYAQRDDAAFAATTGLLYFEGSVVIDGSFQSTTSDDTLQERGQLTDYLPDITQAPAPQFRVSRVWRNRLWCADGPEFRHGKVSVTNASRTVTGVNEAGSDAGTFFGRGCEGMVFRKSGDSRDYDVESNWYQNDNSSPSTEAVTLTQAYGGSTTSNNAYTIRPKRSRVWFSEEGDPSRFSWSDGFLLGDGDDGDPFTGLVPVNDRLLACSARGTWRIGYDEYPTEAGNTAQPISRQLGCLSEGSMVEILNRAYWLSHEGVVQSDGNSVEVISTPLRAMFVDQEDPDYVLRRAHTQLADVAEATHYPARNQYLLAVRTASGGTQGADTVLIYNYLYDTWDTLKLRNGLVRWCMVKDDSGRDVLMFFDAYGMAWRWDTGHADGAGEINNRGTLVAPVSAAGSLYLDVGNGAYLFTSSMSANFSSATLGLNGAWVKILRGTGVGQKRRIQKNTSTRIYIDEVWDTTPDATSIIEIGGIEWAWRGKMAYFEDGPNRVKRLANLSVDYAPQAPTAAVTVNVYRDGDTRTWAEIKTDENRARVPEEDDVEAPSFLTSGDGRALVGLLDAEGYALRVELTCDAPDQAVEIRGLGCVYSSKTEDRA